MDNSDHNIDDFHQKRKKAIDDFERFSERVACVINGNEMSKMSDTKSKTPGINGKLVEMQLELVVNEKFKIGEKLVAVENERDNFERELRKLKSRYEKQETKLQILRREIESMNQRKKDVFAKVYLVKSQESVHDALVRSFKRQLDEKMIEMLNGRASRNARQIYGMEPVRVQFHSMKNIPDRNHSQNLNSILQRKPQVRLTRLPLASSSGTVIRRSESISTTSQVTTTKTADIRRLLEIKHSSNADNKRRASQAIVEGHRPKRTLRCTLCSKQYLSKPTQALCYCQYKNQLD